MTSSLVGSEMCIRDSASIDPYLSSTIPVVCPDEVWYIMRSTPSGRTGGPNGIRSSYVKYAADILYLLVAQM
eukprot:9876237-Prorocentrum_lima.AAC.1